jgi:hypothetical protein
MKLNSEGLQERLLEVVGDEELTKALHETAVKLAPEFDGKPSEFGKAVYKIVKDSGLKVADGAIYNLMARVLNESLILGEGGGDQSSSSGKGGSEDEKPKATVPPKHIKVALKPSIAAYGGQFYDPETKIWIKGTEANPQEVLATLFVKHKVANGELIEVD